LFITYDSVQNSVQRNIKILVDDNLSPYHTILEIYQKNLNIIVFWSIDNSIFEEGFFLEDYCISDFEILEESILDNFTESFTWHWLYNVHQTNANNVNIIVDRWSIELSQQQLNNIWRMIENVEKKHHEYPRHIATNRTSIRAETENAFIYSSFEKSFNRRIFNFLHARCIDEYTDYNLLELTHYLADISPIYLGWELSPLEQPVLIIGNVKNE
jgi:hypothetical protein